MSSNTVIGRAAFVGALVALPLGTVHALARYATAAGAEDLELPGVRVWADPARRLLEPLLTWSDPQTVYLTYGKLWLFILAAVTGCAFVIRRQRLAAGLVRGAERVGWWLVLPAYSLITLSLLGSYWTPWVDESFVALGLPGVLLSVVGSIVLGIGLLRRRMRPVATGILLVTFLPLFVVISNLVALGAALWPLLWAWGLAGRDLGRTSTSTAPTAEPVAV